MANGTGNGMAGYDASGDPCINLGGWPVEYEARGFFNPETCTLELTVIESWPKTEAHAVCLGYGSEVEGPPYKLVIEGIKLSETKIRDDIPLTQDEISWVNSFTLVPGMGTENLNCLFPEAPSE
jgi:hypothetical protein